MPCGSGVCESPVPLPMHPPPPEQPSASGEHRESSTARDATGGTSDTPSDLDARRGAWPAWLPLLLAALAYPLQPGHPLAPLPGLPLDELSLVALALVGLLFFGWAPRRPARWDRHLVGALVALSILKV